MSATITLKDLGKLSEDLDDYMLWAQRWHKQAGGYTASDTFITMYRMEEWARRLEAVTGLPETRLRDGKHLRKSNPLAESAQWGMRRFC
jgi:hypothetical protein